MADMVGGGLGGMTGALQGTVTNIVGKGQNYLDRFFPPEKRQDLYAKISKFATEKPMLAVSLPSLHNEYFQPKFQADFDT